MTNPATPPTQTNNVSLQRKSFSQCLPLPSKDNCNFQFDRRVKMSAKMDEDEDGNTGSGVAIVETNRFGFILGNGEADSDAPCPELVRHRETKWLSLIKQWEQVMEKKSKQVKGQCQKGIPASVRAKCWPLLCGATDRMKNNKNLYERLVGAPDQQGWTEIIKRDTDRQFPFHEMFQSKDGHGQKDLLDVLKAYTQYRPEEGYCQGQGPVAAVLLMNMPAEEAFWCLAQISEHYLPGYYSPLLEGVLFDAAILLGVLKKLCPAAHKHLHKQGVEPLMFATDWLMCLYSRHLPFNTLLRVWDLFFCYGVRVLFQVAVVLVRRCLGEGRQRKECDGQMETLERLRGVKERVQNDQTDAFIHEVCSVPLSLTDLQKQTDKEMEKWKKERSDSTFDPRGRCHGYRMAWGKVQNKQKEKEKKDRQKGSLTLPVMRSHSSLSPLLHKRWMKRGCRTDTEEWDGGGRKLSQSMMEENDDGELRRRSVCGVVGEQRAKQDRLANEFQAHKEKDLNIHADVSVVVSCSIESDVFEEENEDPACVSQKQRDSTQEDKLHTHTDNRTDNIERAVKQKNDHLPARQDHQKLDGKTCQDEQNVGRMTRQDEQKSDRETCQDEQKSDRETCQDEEKEEKETCQDEQNIEKQIHQNEQNVEIQNYDPQEEDIQTNCGKQNEEIQSDCKYEKDQMQTGGCKQNIQETETDALQAVTIPGDSHEDEENIQKQQITSETEEQPHVVQEDLSINTYRGPHEENIHSERQEDDNIVESHTDADKEKAGVQQEVVSDVKIPEEREITDQSNGKKEDNKESEENRQEIRIDERDCDDHKADKETMQTCESVLTSSSVDTEPEGSDVQPSKSTDPEHNDSDCIVTLDATDGSNISNSQMEDAKVAYKNSEDGDMHIAATGINDLNLETSEESKTALSEDTEDISSNPDNQGGIDACVSGGTKGIEHFETEFGDKPPIKDGSGNLEIKEVQVTAASGNQEGNDMHVTAESDNQESKNKHVTTRPCDSESSALESTNKLDNLERNAVDTADGSGNPECTTDGSGNLQYSASAVSAQSPALESPSSITPSKRPNIPPSQLRLHSSRTSHPTILCEDTFREPKQTSTDHTHTAKQTNTPTTQSPLICQPETNSTFKPEITQETQTQPNQDLQTKKSIPKRLGLFRRLRGDTNKNPIPKILVQDFSEKEERLTSKERRRRKREMERKEREEKERKKREKEMEKDKERQRKKPQTRGKSFQVLNRKCAENNDSIESHTLRSRRNSAPFSDSYF